MQTATFKLSLIIYRVRSWARCEDNFNIVIGSLQSKSVKTWFLQRVSFCFVLDKQSILDR